MPRAPTRSFTFWKISIDIFFFFSPQRLILSDFGNKFVETEIPSQQIYSAGVFFRETEGTVEIMALIIMPPKKQGRGKAFSPAELSDAGVNWKPSHSECEYSREVGEVTELEQPFAFALDGERIRATNTSNRGLGIGPSPWIPKSRIL
jgi:hypothetical protein